jgi:spore maturation protein CgeB
VRVVMFCHSLISDWNHGNAHFLRGIATELLARGHTVSVHEPQDSWSAQNLLAEHGEEALTRFHRAYPSLSSIRYPPEQLALETAVDGAELVLVHEWNSPALVQRLGALRAQRPGMRLLFHDTHHRAVTDPQAMAAYDLRHYDGVLAFGRVIRDLYLERGWAQQVWTWHEAADTRVFRPLEPAEGEPTGDLVWIGNWGDEERTAELAEFLLEPVAALGLRALVHGVRYPPRALAALARCGIRHGGWLPNFEVPKLFAQHRVTLHVPRRPYVQALPGIPTIRPFEALACGIPLVSAPWADVEGLFKAGMDFWIAKDGAEMTQHLRTLVNEPETARALAAQGLATLRARHTCVHRVDELFQIFAQLQGHSTAKAANA